MDAKSALYPYREALTRCFLFSQLSFDEIERAVQTGCELRTFSPQQVIYEPTSFKRCVGILLHGRALVYTPEESAGQSVLLNILNPSQPFGVAALFGPPRQYVSLVRAQSCCTVLFLSERRLSELFKQDFRFAQNYIAFLSHRIYFLNRKIAAFTLSTCEEKLARYLLENAYERDGVNQVELSCSLTELAQALNVSRASLYRAMEQLQNQGLVIKKGRKFTLPDLAGLERAPLSSPDSSHPKDPPAISGDPK